MGNWRIGRGRREDSEAAIEQFRVDVFPRVPKRGVECGWSFGRSRLRDD